jgi:hypothetical protein
MWGNGIGRRTAEGGDEGRAAQRHTKMLDHDTVPLSGEIEGVGNTRLVVS